MKERTDSIPSREELEPLCRTMTVDQIAERYMASERRVWNWLYKYGLKPILRPKSKPKEIDMDFVVECLKKGMYIEDIAQSLKVSQPTLSKRMKACGVSATEIRKNMNKQQDDQPKGYHCKQFGAHSCKYWAKGAGCCDYILITGKKRPCPPWNCTVYEKGKRKRDYGWSINGERESDN